MTEDLDRAIGLARGWRHEAYACTASLAAARSEIEAAHIEIPPPPAPPCPAPPDLLLPLGLALLAGIAAGALAAVLAR